MAQARSNTRAGEARIGGSARVRGRVRGEGDLVVEGQVEGDIVLQGDLTVAEGATVSGEAVEAARVAIAGVLEADVQASGIVRLAATARVRGNVRGGPVVIDDGARFSGRIETEFELPPELGGAPRADGRARAPGRR